jgi:hypothetical protein
MENKIMEILGKILDFIMKYPDQSAIIIASLALFVSAISTILAINSVKLQREHNYISVRPVADLIFSDFENYIAVQLKNNGLGPMVIKEFNVLENNEFKANNLIDLMPDQPETIPWKNFEKEINNRTFGTSEELFIIELGPEKAFQEFIRYRDNIRKNLSPLTIIIKYHSLYNEKLLTYKRDLSWFGRNIENE